MNPEEFLEINAEAFRTPRTRVNNTLISIRDSAASHVSPMIRHLVIQQNVILV